MGTRRNSLLQDTHLLAPRRYGYNVAVIYVIASIELRPDTRERFLTELASVATEVRAEAGCIEYCAALDEPSGLKAQIPLRADAVTIVERWISLDALAAHAITPHMQAFRVRTAECVLRTSLQVLAPCIACTAA